RDEQAGQDGHDDAEREHVEQHRDEDERERGSQSLKAAYNTQLCCGRCVRSPPPRWSPRARPLLATTSGDSAAGLAGSSKTTACRTTAVSRSSGCAGVRVTPAASAAAGAPRGTTTTRAPSATWRGSSTSVR